MMEYPEVVCMRDQMRETLIGKRIRRVFVEHMDEYAGTIRGTLLIQPPDVFQRRLEGGKIVGVENVCQTLLIAVDTGHTLNLGAIYGAIRYHPTSETLPRRKRPCLQLDFADGTYLTVVISLFGEIRVLDEAEKAAYLAKRDARQVTPDSEWFTLEGFRAALAEEAVAKVSAKKLLTSRMPVYYVDGLGGGYVQEILYRAKIHPKRKLRSLTGEEQEAYYRSMGGRYNERDLYGQPGGFTPHVRKETLSQPCPTCYTPIVRLRFEGGHCYVCPMCQPPSLLARKALDLARQGSVAWQEKRFAEARQFLEHSLSLSEQEQYVPGIVGAKHLLGNIAFDEGDLKEARAMHEQVLADCRDSGYLGGIASTLIGLGSVAAREGKYGRARSYLEEGLQVAREIGLEAYKAAAQKKLDWVDRLQSSQDSERA
jgi:formamidopyrimidine-DNA glycosylase